MYKFTTIAKKSENYFAEKYIRRKRYPTCAVIAGRFTTMYTFPR